MAIGAIFDFDGVLVDSCAWHERCWRAVARELGLRMSKEQFLEGMGVKNDFFISQVLHWTTDPAEVARITRRKEEIFHSVLGEVCFIPGSEVFVRKLVQAGVRCAIGSSSGRENIDKIFGKNETFKHCFSTIVTAEDTLRGKPDPSIFLRAAEGLQREPSACIVFEDAPLGILAAHAASMKAVALTTTFDREKLLAAGADRIVDTLEALATADLEELLNP